ncbi:MAG: FkbM family methyltransferase [Armatimonadota bacterium]|nr:FkbM family methyltransferase [Armatimonadota bacterium]
MPTLDDRLNEILGRNADHVVSEQSDRVRGLVSSRGGSIIIFGAGRLGRDVLDGLKRTGIQPLAFADNNPASWGKAVDGLKVISPKEAAAYTGKAVFVTGVYTSEPLRKQLLGMGVDVITFPQLAWAYPDAFLPHCAVEHPYSIFKNASDVRAAMSLWADEESKREYAGQLDWRTSLDPEALPPHRPADETYYPEDLAVPAANEVFVDCGAFDGDSIRDFIERRNGDFRKAIAIEPDPTNAGGLKSFIEGLPGEVAGKIEVMNYAVGDCRETVKFDASGTVQSSMGSGSYEAQCVLLDDLISEESPTYLKMDIEGAEIDALKGALLTITHNAPLLAICVYHRQEHLWQVPLLIASMSDKYKLFLRRYSDECWEMVCYAIPISRCKV